MWIATGMFIAGVATLLLSPELDTASPPVHYGLLLLAGSQLYVHIKIISLGSHNEINDSENFDVVNDGVPIN